MNGFFGASLPGSGLSTLEEDPPTVPNVLDDSMGASGAGAGSFLSNLALTSAILLNSTLIWRLRVAEEDDVDDDMVRG